MAESGANPPIERVTIKNREYRAVREGLAQILAPYRETTTTTVVDKSGQPNKPKFHNNDQGDQAVFYNPIQQYNRDLSVLAILVYGEGALEDKRLKWKKNSRGGRVRRKGRSKDVGLRSDVSTTETNVKKRKADVMDQIEATFGIEPDNEAKKIKVDNGHDEDELMEVRELAGRETNDEDATTATHSVTNGDDVVKQEKQPSFTILDALSASGLRAIRYAKEIPFATSIVANDLSPEAAKSIELNIDHNEVREKVHSNVGDARAYMYSKVGNESQFPTKGYVHRFDVIDLDPYGTAAPFLDSAVQALGDGGLLCVTCTDAGVFASNGYPEKAYSSYGGTTMKGQFSHEAGLRLILHAVASSGARYGIAIEPLLSLSIDFYARLFIRVHKKQADVKLLAGTTMITYNCDNGCGAWTTQPIARNQVKSNKVGEDFYKHGYAQGPTASPRCEHCGYVMHMGGPMWAGPLHNSHFIKRLLNKLPGLDNTTYGTTERLKGMLTLALEEDLSYTDQGDGGAELEPKSGAEVAGASVTDARIPRLPAHLIDKHPFFLVPSAMAAVLHAQSPSEQAFRGALRSLGYRVSHSHCKRSSVKTDAPWDVLWEVMREWVRQKAPIKEGTLKEGHAGWRIMSRARNTDRKRVSDILEEIKVGAGNDGSTEQLKQSLEAALYRLQNGVPSGTDESKGDRNGENGESAEPEKESPNPSRQIRDLSRLEIVFDSDLGRDKRRGKLVRYQENPRANWGPMSRAGGGS